ncbi:hypothetical protein U7537_04630 [Lacticaseibacillus rhamnosus]
MLLTQNRPEQSNINVSGKMRSLMANEDPETIQQLLHNQVIENFLRTVNSSTMFRLIALYYLGTFPPMDIEEATEEYKALVNEWKERGHHVAARQLAEKLESNLYVQKGAKQLNQNV